MGVDSEGTTFPVREDGDEWPPAVSITISSGSSVQWGRIANSSYQ